MFPNWKTNAPIHYLSKNSFNTLLLLVFSLISAVERVLRIFTRDERGLIIFPVFYDLEPSDLRNWKTKFRKAFAKQEAKNATKAKLWTKALVEVSEIYGLELKKTADGSPGVLMVGIWGVGGSGKTTLAYTIYKKISKQFHGKCIVENVREKTSKYGLEKLQENMLSALFEKEENIQSVREGIDIIKNMEYDKIEAMNIVSCDGDDSSHFCKIVSNMKKLRLLIGKDLENGSMLLQLEGLEIPKGFTPPLLKGNSCKLELPENWCNDYSGLLICVVCSNDVCFNPYHKWINMKKVSGMDSKDDVVWKESDGGNSTLVWYVSFDLLRHASWWDQTHNVVSFNIDDHLENRDHEFCSGFGVRLIDKKSRSGLTETSTNSSSHYTPKFKIQHDSAYAVTASLTPYHSS
ncbi:hypothetical protein L1987_30877 [Smallanthus sonchifolius]|uniref:Uncharacterized protein n=1 Tax=Smallanthus sonchifolius TaxID=185202 RepID=A0ACB9I5I9_9ASTR|nr:hypothetical protein L1987_30877 [Smallanthus sonchifolius]